MKFNNFLSTCFLIFVFSCPVAAMHAHSRLIDMPPQFDLNKISHLYCDCFGLVEDGYSCGAYALTHAYQDQLDFSGTHLPPGMTPIKKVKAAFTKLSLDVDDKRQLSKNIFRTAQELRLNFTFLQLPVAGVRELLLQTAQDTFNHRAAWQAIEEVQKRFEQTKGAFSHSILVGFPESFVGHAAAITINRDRQGAMTMHVVDNLNKPLVYGEPYYTLIEMLYKCFFDIGVKEWAQREFLFLYSLENSAIKNIDDFFKTDSEYIRSLIIKDVFKKYINTYKEAWQNKKDVNIRPLNYGMKALKILAIMDENSGVNDMVIETYETMLDVIENGRGENRLELAESIFKAIEKTAEKPKTYHIKQDIINQLSQKAQLLIQKIKKWQQSPQRALEQASLELINVLDKNQESKSRDEYLSAPNPAEQKQILFALFDEWRVNQRAACYEGPFTLQPLNEGIIPLKKLAKVDKSATSLLIKVYGAMLSAIQEAKAPLSFAEMVEKAINKSITDGFLDPADLDVSQIITDAQRIIGD